MMTFTTPPLSIFLRQANELSPSGISGFSLEKGEVAIRQLDLVPLGSHAD
jgi:hypothetical protein